MATYTLPATPISRFETARFVVGLLIDRWHGRIRARIARYREEAAAAEAQRDAVLISQGRHPIQFIRRDPNFPCVACGARNGEIRWAPQFKWPTTGNMGALIHQCKVCKATWGERPIISAEEWRITLSAEERRLFEEAKKNA